MNNTQLSLFPSVFMKKNEECKRFDKELGGKLKNLIENNPITKNITAKEIAGIIDISSTQLYKYWNGKDSIKANKIFQFINLLNFSDPEIVSLFKDSAANGEHKKEIKQPELVKITEPEPVQKYCGIMKKAYDMQDNNPEIKGKLSGAFTLIESIESDIKKIKREKKEDTAESKC